MAKTPEERGSPSCNEQSVESRTMLRKLKNLIYGNRSRLMILALSAFCATSCAHTASPTKADGDLSSGQPEDSETENNANLEPPSKTGPSNKCRIFIYYYCDYMWEKCDDGTQKVTKFGCS